MTEKETTLTDKQVEAISSAIENVMSVIDVMPDRITDGQFEEVTGYIKEKHWIAWGLSIVSGSTDEMDELADMLGVAKAFFDLVKARRIQRSNSVARYMYTANNAENIREIRKSLWLRYD